MKRIVAFFVIFVVAGSTAFTQATWRGLWDGSLALDGGQMPFSLSIVPDGALLDLPGAELYGYPSMAMQSGGSSLRLSFAFGGGVLTLVGTETEGTVEGSYRQENDDPSAPGTTGADTSSGAFTMARSPAQPDPRVAFSFAGSDGAELPGTLLEPVGAGTSPAEKPPLIILHAGLGAADRDGNNYNVPGKNDALRQLAEALAELSLRQAWFRRRFMAGRPRGRPEPGGVDTRPGFRRQGLGRYRTVLGDMVAGAQRRRCRGGCGGQRIGQLR